MSSSCIILVLIKRRVLLIMYLFFTLTRPCARIVKKQWHHSITAIIGMLLYIAWNQKFPFISHSWLRTVHYLLTYSMVQSPSWETNWFAASQEIPRISRNPKIHYRTHKPPVSVLGQPNPVHTPTSHLLEIHPNIIHPSTPRSPQWFPSLRFPHQDPIHPPLLTVHYITK